MQYFTWNLLLLIFCAAQNMDALDRFNYIMHNQKQHHAFPNQNLRILHPIINTCILECGNDPDHRLCQSKFILYIIIYI